MVGGLKYVLQDSIDDKETVQLMREFLDGKEWTQGPTNQEFLSRTYISLEF